MKTQTIYTNALGHSFPSLEDAINDENTILQTIEHHKELLEYYTKLWHDILESRKPKFWNCPYCSFECEANSWGGPCYYHDCKQGSQP